MAPGFHGEFASGGGGVAEAQRTGVAEEGLQARPFPKAHAGGDMALTVGAEGPHLGFKLVDDLIQSAQPVAAGVVPEGGKDHRTGEELLWRQAAGAARYGLAILAETPAGIEGLAKDMGPVAVQDRLEPKLG
jgi:hypothetical protein